MVEYLDEHFPQKICPQARQWCWRRQQAQIQVKLGTAGTDAHAYCCDRLLENHKNLQVPQFQRSLAYLSSHNSKLDSTPVALLSVHPVRSLDKAGKHILSSYCVVKSLSQDSLVVSLSKHKGGKKEIRTHSLSSKHGVTLFKLWENVT